MTARIMSVLVAAYCRWERLNEHVRYTIVAFVSGVINGTVCGVLLIIFDFGGVTSRVAGIAIGLLVTFWGHDRLSYGLGTPISGWQVRWIECMIGQIGGLGIYAVSAVLVEIVWDWNALIQHVVCMTIVFFAFMQWNRLIVFRDALKNKKTVDSPAVDRAWAIRT